MRLRDLMTDNTESVRALMTDSSRTDGNRVLIVAKDGTIRNVLQSPDIEYSEAVTSLGARSIDELWSADIVRRIKENIRRALRSRQYYCDAIREGDGGLNIEFIYVAQGPDRVLMIARDITEQQSALSKMQQLAYVDEATSLPNREMFLKELKKIVDHQQLREGRFAVICCNLDQIDETRNKFGAAQQDVILQQLAQRLTQALRGANSQDAADYERYSVVARNDFHQFGVVLPSIEGGGDAEAVTTRIIAALQEPVKIGDRAVKMRAFAGISLFPQDGQEPAVLFENAVAAMEDARCSHKSNYKFHTGTVKLRTLQRQDLELELKTALDREEFALNYLPVVDANTGRVRSVEALLRWPESILGLHSTRKVVSIAELTGLIVPIGEWVVQTSCAQLKKWHEAGQPKLRLSVNMSVQEFSRPDIAHKVASVLMGVGLQPSSLDIEITEHMLFRDAMKNYETSKALKAIGIGIVVDDFGVGSCSLAHMSHSPIDAIKIDNTLVAQLETSGRDNAACDGAIALGHALGLNVIGEGVETEEQGRLLRELGCDMLQGYHYFAPLTAAEFDDYMALSGDTQKNRAIRND